MTHPTCLPSMKTATSSKRRQSRHGRGQAVRLAREAMRLREKAIKRNRSAELIRHGDWHLDRALYSWKNVHKLGLPELISRVQHELVAAIDAYMHAADGVPERPFIHLAALIDGENLRTKLAKSARNSAK
ncbi:hypothetical protein [Pseudomonas sp. 2hn]|uniref:hypothetical protein n=1 Tax=Pseudomonas sp. 2hn TaxID=2866626 RepID=UPI001C7E052C|nr:hypothetical protein [Pseudomonas sp. 2hn]QZA57163.1 hypothetical protein K2O50_16530 [Pseudomonas sp. 2hn]